MRIWTDFHHSALLRSLVYLFADRLDHKLSVVSVELATCTGTGATGVWGTTSQDAMRTTIGLTDHELRNVSMCSVDQFMANDFDAYLITRTETMEVLKRYGHPLKGKIYIAQSGNEYMPYEWDWIGNALCSDLETYSRIDRSRTNAIFSPQELARFIRPDEYEPITEENRFTVASFMHNLKGYDCQIRPWHLPPEQTVNLFREYMALRIACPSLKGYNFEAYGAQNDEIFGVGLTEAQLRLPYLDAGCGWHYKTHEGYGHGLLNFLAAGRPVVCPAGFYDRKTAGLYLMDRKNCIMTDYTAQGMCMGILDVTNSLEHANELGRCAYDTFDMIDFPGHAESAKHWLDNARAY